MYKKTTQIPNLILDQYLRTLNASELKILLVILRQTHGWRKTRDRISYSQFMEKTGYSRRVLTKAIQSLESKGLIIITGRKGNSLNSRSRKGSWLYFSYQHVHFPTQRSALLGGEHVHSSAYNKTNKTKLTNTKGRTQQRLFQLVMLLPRWQEPHIDKKPSFRNKQKICLPINCLSISLHLKSFSIKYSLYIKRIRNTWI